MSKKEYTLTSEEDGQKIISRWADENQAGSEELRAAGKDDDEAARAKGKAAERKENFFALDKDLNNDLYTRFACNFLDRDVTTGAGVEKLSSFYARLEDRLSHNANLEHIYRSAVHELEETNGDIDTCLGETDPQEQEAACYTL